MANDNADSEKGPKVASVVSSTSEAGRTRRLTEALKNKIKHGEIAPGQRLVEADLIRETGQSRGRVREAIKALAAEGLVVVEEFRGAFVKKYTPEEVFQIGQARENLESFAARLIAERNLGTELRNELSAIQKGLDEAAESMRFDQYVRLNEQLHSFIYANCGNQFVATFLERLRIPIFRLQHQAMYSHPQFLEGNAEHQRIVSAILEGDGDLAEALMRSHVRKGSRTLHDIYYTRSKELGS